jgi:hypothetical protein
VPVIVNENQSPAVTATDNPVADAVCVDDNAAVIIVAPEGGNAANVLCFTAIEQLPDWSATNCHPVIVPLYGTLAYAILPLVINALPPSNVTPNEPAVKLAFNVAVTLCDGDDALAVTSPVSACIELPPAYTGILRTPVRELYVDAPDAAIVATEPAHIVEELAVITGNELTVTLTTWVFEHPEVVPVTE